MKKEEWEIPSNLQPDPSDYSFDLERALKGVVNLKSYVPADASTANSLGTERAGSGVMIKSAGLIVTIGYLITEAETLWITSNDGQAVPGHALAQDQESGFGLVQALGKLDVPALELGDSDRLKVGDQAVFVPPRVVGALGEEGHHWIRDRGAPPQGSADEPQCVVGIPHRHRAVELGHHLLHEPAHGNGEAWQEGNEIEHCIERRRSRDLGEHRRIENFGRDPAED